MLHLKHHIDEAVTDIKSQWIATPRVGIVLGSGLGGLAEQVEQVVTIDYSSIPHFPHSTALGHQGCLVCGQLDGVPSIVMQGRSHLYEGYTAAQVALPVRVMAALGIELLIVSNAAGGLNPNYQPGDVMIIEDHINLMADNPLTGINDERLGPRFPDMSEPYDRQLIDQAVQIARRENLTAHVGVYAAQLGPIYETRAEYRFLRGIGVDAAGMSTVPEVIVAAHGRLRVLAMSAIANVCIPDRLGKTSGQNVVKAASAAEPKMRSIVRGVLEQL
ncbi:MAG: purine-nucleoside phosphorylase [Planctomycetales bacterium]